MPIYTRRKETGPLTSTANWDSFNTNSGSAHNEWDYISHHSFAKGQNTPGYHKLKAEGALLPFTHWDQVVMDVKLNNGTYRSDQSSSSYYETATGVNVNALLSCDTNRFGTPDMAQASYMLQKAAAEIYSRGWDGLTAASELKKTVRSFKTVTKRLVDLTTKFSPKRLNDLWLEGRYGFRTLAYDIRDLHSAATEFDSLRKIHTERSGYSYSEFDEDSFILNTSDTKWTITTTTEHKYSIRGSVAAIIKPSRIVTNPVQTGWELVPYSFVVDWVYDVGTAIQAASFLSASKQHTSAIGFVDETIVEAEMRGTAQPGFTHTGGPNGSTFTGTRTSRTPSGIMVRPQLTNRNITGALALDLQALSRIRG
jgi:hypothetical protein